MLKRIIHTLVFAPPTNEYQRKCLTFLHRKMPLKLVKRENLSLKGKYESATEKKQTYPGRIRCKNASFPPGWETADDNREAILAAQLNGKV